MPTKNEEIPSSPELNAEAQPRENPEPIRIDPACIKDALRMYFQPIRNDDPVVDFYTMYKRETMQYDTEYMNKYNEDLNTTLIFAGLFSAVSSAFVIAFQPGLQQDPSDRSEAYLRAILLSINPSISPDEHPNTTSTWNGPPQEIVMTLDLLYASLLMSLLAAFVAMLGKQWLNRYLRHTGGSMIERCGDRQRKFDGIEKWPFRAFIESLPILLQIALFLLTSGLSRYMWSINGSVARVIISFTLLSFFFYVGIVIAGTSSYECPFQTPASTGLRALKDSGLVGRILTRASSYASALSRITSDKARKLRQVIQRSTRTTPLPSTVDDMKGSPPTPQNSTGLRIVVQDLESIQRQNVANGRCVCWVLRNMTDPEAIDFAICLAGIIRWFDGGLDYEPPFETIVSFFTACFDSAKQLHPCMRDRAYFSARAILQIYVRAGTCGHRYLLPVAFSSPFPDTDNDLRNLLDILATLRGYDPVLELPDVHSHTPAHSSWVSGFFVDLLSVSPNLPLSRKLGFGKFNPGAGYLSAAAIDHQVVIANTLITVVISLGGHVERETFWAVDKSGWLDTIFSHLSTTVIKVIAERRHPGDLEFLSGFLAAWKKRPNSLTPFAFRWCCAISEEMSRPHSSAIYILELTLIKFLEIGFRFVDPDYRSGRVSHPGHSSHLETIFRAVSSRNDEVVADALCALAAGGGDTSRCSLGDLFHNRTRVGKPLSPRLRQISIRIIENLWRETSKAPGDLLKCLDVGLDEMTTGKRDWGRLIFEAARSSLDAPLPFHHWRLLDELVKYTGVLGKFEELRDINTMKLLEGDREWEKLEVWMMVIWEFLERPAATEMEGVERVTLKLLLRRPSVLPRFEELSKHPKIPYLDRKLLESPCSLALMKRNLPATRFLQESLPSPEMIQARSIEAAPGSLAVAHPESAHDPKLRGSKEEEGGEGGCIDNGCGGEGGQQSASTSVNTRTNTPPPGQGTSPSPGIASKQPTDSNGSERPNSDPAIMMTQSAGGASTKPLLATNNPDNLTLHHPPLSSSPPQDSGKNSSINGQPTENNERQSTISERECIEEFWTRLGPKERNDLAMAEKDVVLDKLAQRYDCDCNACYWKWSVIDSELVRRLGEFDVCHWRPKVCTKSLSRAGSERGELSSLGDSFTVSGKSFSCGNDREEALEELVKAMTHPRILRERAPTTDIEDHRDCGYAQLLSEQLEEVFSTFVPQLFFLRLLEAYRETGQVLRERQQKYRKWLQELMDEDEGVVEADYIDQHQ